ncbi:MAG: hypothetical protein FRX49_08509 [Trebouxia sp. A1-2]|nr:MAG: hypothetical protein FRX49_08509 [Trebouxia sp. A1-2]
MLANHFVSSGKNAEVDVVAQQGLAWIEVKAHEAFGIGSNQWLGNPGHFSGFERSFHAADEGIFAEDVLEARKQREEESWQTGFMNVHKLKTLADLHSFIHREHTCYSVAHQAVFGHLELDDVADKALASY